MPRGLIVPDRRSKQDTNHSLWSNKSAANHSPWRGQTNQAWSNKSGEDKTGASPPLSSQTNQAEITRRGADHTLRRLDHLWSNKSAQEA